MAMIALIRLILLLTSCIGTIYPIPLPSESRLKYAIEDLPPSIPDLDALFGPENTVDNADTKIEYKPSLGVDVVTNEAKEPNCHTEQRVHFEDKCENYTETICYTNHKETCQQDWLKNCTGIIQTKVERKCFNVLELVCSLREDILYQTLKETYQIQRCFVAKDRVCDTIYAMDTENQDDYQCIEVETPNCFMESKIINDVICTDSVDFTCKNMMPSVYDSVFIPNKETSPATQVVCERRPTKQCYAVPRMVNVETCETDIHKYCEKFTNTVPVPYEQQNCHFSPRKICEIQDRKRIRKGKKFVYSTDCDEVPREICDTVETRVIEPVCSWEKRHKCSYEPEEHCADESKQHCYIDEKVVLEKVCDDKLVTEFL